MPRSGVNGTYSLPGAQATQVPGTPIPSAVNNQGWSDVEQTFNSVQPVAYGGTGVADGKPLDNTFGVKNNTDPTKIGVFNAAGIPAGTTRTYDLPYSSGTLGLVSDIRGQIYGLTLSNNVTDPTNDIDIEAGSAVDSSGVRSMLLATAITKRLDAVWAVGTNQGMLASGAALTNTWYHIFVICRPDTGVVDIAADTSPSGSNIPANTNVAYTLRRRIGSIFRTGGVIKPFFQIGDRFVWISPTIDTNATNPGTSAINATLTTPSGIRTLANISYYVFDTGTLGSSIALYISALFQTDTAPNSGGPFTAVSTVAPIQGASGYYEAKSDQGVIRLRLSASGPSTVLRILTHGYTDTRGS